MKKVKIAQIGAGHDHANVTIESLKLMSDIYELVGFCSVPEDSYNLPRMGYEGGKACYSGVPMLSLEEILNYPGLEAVCIETEDRALTKYALMAAERGLHIHMDKPGGISDEEYDLLLDTAEKNKLVFQVGYMYRYNPAVLKLKEDIAAGKFGDIISVEAQMNCPHGLDKRDWLGGYPGGMLYYLGCHMIDLVYSIMGEPEEIIPLSCSSGLDGTTAEDFGMAVFKYKSGISFAKSTAIEIGGFERRQLIAVGTKGTADICPIEWSGELDNVIQPLTAKVREAFPGGWYDEAKRHTTAPFGRYDAMLRAFAAYINDEQENPFSYSYERKLHKLLLRACGCKLSKPY